MYYYTQPIQPPTKQISLEEILAGEIENLYKYSPKGNWTTTRTITLVEKPKVQYMHGPETDLAIFNAKFGRLVREDMSGYYSSYKIPKRSGGFRTIDNPCAELREAHDELKRIIEKWMTTYHTAAFAYVKNRCAKDAVVRHKIYGSNWFLRTDFSNFFGSITPEFLNKMLLMQVPWCSMSDQGKAALADALKLCFLRGGLPQGTTISPMLTNILMIPIDYTLFNTLTHRCFVYTRYADDIQISAKEKFNYREIVSLIDKTLEDFGASFRIKPEKTKWSSCAGINYMLGLNINKEHNITVGHARKKTFKAMVNNFLADYLNGVRWSSEDINYMRGIYSYYRSIEQEYTDYMVRHLEEKYKVSFFDAIRKTMK